MKDIYNAIIERLTSHNMDLVTAQWAALHVCVVLGLVDEDGNDL